jgi:hypothetical protein
MEDQGMIEAARRLQTTPRALAMTALLIAAFLFGCAPDALAQVSAAQLVSVNSAGTGSANNISGVTFTGDAHILADPVISANGRYVAFTSRASNLVTNDTNGTTRDVFVRDLQAGTTILVSVRSDGMGSGNGASFSPSISSDGRFVAFVSKATDLVASPSDTDTANDIFVRDLQTNTTILASVRSDGTGSGDGLCETAVMSENGQAVAFVSTAGNLTALATGGTKNIYVRDLIAMTTVLASINSSNDGAGNADSILPSLSSDGKMIVFESKATTLASNDTNGFGVDIFARDLVAGTTLLVSANGAGNGSGNANAGEGTISKDGHVVAFISLASDLLPNDTNHNPDVYARDLQTNTLELLTVNAMGVSGGGFSNALAINSDGRFVTFQSQAGDLVTNDTNGTFDIFVRDRATDTTELVSVNSSGSASADSGSALPVISDDGRFVAFVSTAGNLVMTADLNAALYDVFVRDRTAGTTALVSLNSAGTGSGNDRSSGTSNSNLALFPAISGDGTAITFSSWASDLVTNDTNGHTQDVFAVRLASTTLNFSAAGYNVNESGGNVTLRVNRSGGSVGQVTVLYETINGTAKAPSDYTAKSGTLTFLNGQTTKTIVVPITNDTLFEQNETFSVRLKAPGGGARLGALNAATVTIINNDPPPRISINDVTVTEGDSGVINASFTATLSTASGQTATVQYATSNGTATAPADYTAKSGTLTFTPGQVSKTIIIQVKGDTVPEANETFKITFTGQTNATLGDAQGIGTIINDD